MITQTFPHASTKYRVIRKSLRKFRTRCATTKADTAESSTSIGTESLRSFFCVCVLGTVVYLQVSTLGGSRDETWRGQGIRKRSMSWNFPKLSQLWRCNGGFGPCTTQNHLWTKQFVSGTWNSSRVAACALRNEQAGRGHRPRLSSVCEKRLCLSLCWHSPLRHDHPGYCTAEVGNPGKTCKLPCIMLAGYVSILTPSPSGHVVTTKLMIR
jgi:hypothetical protein